MLAMYNSIYMNVCEGNVTLPETVKDVGGMLAYSFLYHKGNGLTAAHMLR